MSETYNGGYPHDFAKTIFVNSEGETLCQGESYDGENAVAVSNFWGDQLQEKFRNFGRARNGGDFSIIKDACIMPSAFADMDGTNVRGMLELEFGTNEDELEVRLGNKVEGDSIADVLTVLYPLAEDLKRKYDDLEFHIVTWRTGYFSLAMVGEEKQVDRLIEAAIEAARRVVEDPVLKRNHQFIG